MSQFSTRCLVSASTYLYCLQQLFVPIFHLQFQSPASCYRFPSQSALCTHLSPSISVPSILLPVPVSISSLYPSFTFNFSPQHPVTGSRLNQLFVPNFHLQFQSPASCYRFPSQSALCTQFSPSISVPSILLPVPVSISSLNPSFTFNFSPQHPVTGSRLNQLFVPNFHLQFQSPASRYRFPSQSALCTQFSPSISVPSILLPVPVSISSLYPSFTFNFRPQHPVTGSGLHQLLGLGFHPSKWSPPNLTSLTSNSLFWSYPQSSFWSTFFTPGRGQSKTLFTIDKCGSKIVRNSVFDCHLSPVGQSKTLFLMIFLSTFVNSIDVFDCRLPGVFFVFLVSS